MASGVHVHDTNVAQADYPVAESGSVDDESAAVGFDFVVATRTYHVRYGTDLLTIATQAASSGANSDSGSDSASNQFLRSTSPASLSYVGVARWTDGMAATAAVNGFDDLRYFVFGAHTLLTDLPASGTASFVGVSDIQQGTTTFGYGGTVAVTVNWVTGTFAATTSYQRQGFGNATTDLPPQIPTTLSGTIDRSTGKITGTASTGGFTGGAGTFTGYFFGPAAAEVGLVMRIAKPDPGISNGEGGYAGYLVARRQ